MALRKVGKYRGCFSYSEEHVVYTEDFVKFFTKDGVPYGDDDMEQYALFLNSPWAATNETYTISCNLLSPEHPSQAENPWMCTFTVVGYDGLTASILGFGPTEEEALADCKRIFEYLQGRYNPEDNSI